MPELDPIKAKVIIEYDGSGLEQAKEDLASLAGVAGDFGQAVSPVGDALSGMADTVVASTHVTQDFGSSMDALGAPFRSNITALSQWSDALSAHQDVLSAAQPALLGMVSSVQALGAPMIAATRQFVEASAPMVAISEQAQSISEQMSGLGDGFAQIQEPLGQGVLFLPQYADSLHNVGLNAAASQENMAVFQDALQNPYPFSMIQSHLDETGQSWQDFTAAIGDGNTQMLHEMAANADVTHEVLGNAQSMGGIFTESANATEDFTKQFNSLNEAVGSTGKGINELGGVGALAEGSGAAAESVGLGEGLGGVFGAIGDGIGGVMGALSSIAMPLMAVQMISQMVGQLGTGIYNMAALAEGPAAHGVGTFTGSVDALGQTLQKSGEQFSESFGQQMIPTLDAMNYQMSQSNGSGGIGSFLGGTVGLLANTAQVLIGGAGVDIGALIGNDSMRDFFGGISNSGIEGFINQYDMWTGQPLAYQGPNPSSEQAQIQTSLASAVAMMNAQASNPAYLAAQASLSSAQHYAQMDQQAFDVSHPTGTTGPDDPMAAIIRKEMQDVLAAGTAGTAGQPEPNLAGGCFIAGTRVLLADGSERAIETLTVGEVVQSHAGPATIVACILPPPKQVYTLTFVDGKTLTLTDSHPIATPLQGWKALSVEHAKCENPDLPMTTLQVGDSVRVHHGAMRLMSIHPCKGVEQVYNITVDGAHTFYANGVLVHNKISDQIAQQVSGIQLPHMDLSGLTSSLANAFSDIHLPKMPDLAGSVSSELGSLFSGIHVPSLPDIGNSISSELGNLFSGIHLPSLPNIAGELGGELGNLFSGIHLPAMPDFAGQLGSELGSLFSGIHLPKMPDIVDSISSELGGLFSGIQIPKPPDIAGSINSALSSMFSGIHMPGLGSFGIPGFAGGVENFVGGPAFIAESGPELVMLPSGASVYPMSVGAGVGGGNITPISLSSSGGGSSGGNGGSGGPIHFHTHFSVNGRELVSAIGPDLAAEIRGALGLR